VKALNDVIAACPPSGIRRFFDIAAEMDDVISLGVGEPDFVTPWRIREAGIYALEHGFTTYTSNAGLPKLACPRAWTSRCGCCSTRATR
jgi:aminotransferase